MGDAVEEVDGEVGLRVEEMLVLGSIALSKGGCA